MGGTSIGMNVLCQTDGCSTSIFGYGRTSQISAVPITLMEVRLGTKLQDHQVSHGQNLHTATQLLE